MKGEKNIKAKLNQYQVDSIRNLYDMDSVNYSYQRLADFYGMSASEIGRIIRGDTWPQEQDIIDE